MNTSIIRTAYPPSHTSLPCSRLWMKRIDSSSGSTALKFKRESESESRKSLRCVRIHDFGARYSSESNGRRNPNSSATGEFAVADRLQLLVLEFKSLAEPMERVKRLLDYAARLPPCDESARSPENRVAGCATQVWVEAEMEEASGRMKFRADSDSEISKGFCACLIWLLDGAEAEEVLELTAEDFEHVNIGLHGKGHSRASTWHNVLISMQRKTRALLDETKEIRRYPSLSEGYLFLSLLLSL